MHLLDAYSHLRKICDLRISVGIPIREVIIRVRLDVAVDVVCGGEVFRVAPNVDVVCPLVDADVVEAQESRKLEVIIVDFYGTEIAGQL